MKKELWKEEASSFSKMYRTTVGDVCVSLSRSRTFGRYVGQGKYTLAIESEPAAFAVYDPTTGEFALSGNAFSFKPLLDHPSLFSGDLPKAVRRKWRNDVGRLFSHLEAHFAAE